MKQGIIYKITSPSGRIYIGKTVNTNSRITSYRNNNNIGQPLIYQSIKKYGWESHLFEIIHNAPENELNELEINYIQKYNSFHYDNPNGMNLTRGGEGASGAKLSAETIAKQVAKRIGTKRSDATKKLMSDLKKGKSPSCASNPKTEYFLQQARQNMLGRMVLEDEINKRKQTRLDRLIKQHESILQIDSENNNIIKEWIKLPKDISKILNYVNDTGIIKCLNNKISSYKGYKWTYKI
jgi:group I intron endonuclease